MKNTRQNGLSDATVSLYAHQFDGLVIIYFEADGLKRGFQFWLGWPGGTDKLRNCVPIYFAPDIAPLGLQERLRAARGDTLVLLCLARDGAFSSRNIGSLADVLQHGSAMRRGLAVLFATSRTCATWRRRWPLPGSFAFSLGSYTVSPVPRSGDNDEDSSPRRYDLRVVSPGLHAGVRLRGGRARAPSAISGGRAHENHLLYATIQKLLSQKPPRRPARIVGKSPPALYSQSHG